MGIASPQMRVHVSEALTFVRALDFARMEASVNCVIKLNVEAKRTDERVRGMAFLPHGRGKVTRVAVFARGALADEATDAGADLVGAEDLVEQVRRRRRRRHLSLALAPPLSAPHHRPLRPTTGHPALSS